MEVARNGKRAIFIIKALIFIANISKRRSESLMQFIMTS